MRTSAPVNIRDVAKAAGMSTASVSRALRDEPSPYLSAKKREQIRQVAEKLRYRPNIHAKRIFGRRAQTVAVYTAMNFDGRAGAGTGPPPPTLMDESFGSCLLGVNSILSPAGISVLLTEVNDDFLARDGHRAMCRSRMVDGILVWGALLKDRYIEQLAGEGVPLVLLQTDAAFAPCGAVVTDDEAGAAAVACHVAAAGHRRVALLTPSLQGSAGVGRYRGTLAGLARHGVTPVYQSGRRGFGYEFGRRAAETLLRRAPTATAVIASDDAAAWGCVHVLREAGRRVPEDVSVAGGGGLSGYDDTRVCSFRSPSHRVGVEGAEMLLGLLGGGRVAERRVLPVEFYSGTTVAPPCGGGN